MTEIKTSTARGVPSAGATGVPARVKVNPRPMVQPQQQIENREPPSGDQSQVDSSAALISEFTAPPPRTTAWLSDPRLISTLTAASESLAPNGISEDPTDRYAASVLETHLVARRRLMKFTNSLLKT